jgi:hypothetical protein
VPEFYPGSPTITTAVAITTINAEIAKIAKSRSRKSSAISAISALYVRRRISAWARRGTDD